MIYIVAVLAIALTVMFTLLQKEKEQSKRLLLLHQEDEKYIIQLQNRLSRQEHKFQTASMWIRQKIKKKTMKELLEERKIKKIAIYGITDLGYLLVKECLFENVPVECVLDKRIENGQYDFQNIPMKSLIDAKKDLDEDTFIIVTAIAFYDEIEQQLMSEGFRKIISFREILND